MTANHAVVELHLDDRTADMLRRVWDRLKTEGIDDQMPGTGARPHVSLVVGAGVDFRKASDRLAQVCARTRPFRIGFCYLGFFPGENTVGFLGVVHGANLMRLHAEVFTQVEACFGRLDPHYRPSALVMHSTLALAVPGDRLSAYWRVVSGLTLPHEAAVEAIDIVEYFPARVRASLPFGGP
jgi:2'-5' RNA ligase